MSDSSRTPPQRAVVVDDEPIKREIASRLLRRVGLETVAYDAAEPALDALAEGPPPDLIVTDLHMPDIDGWRFCRLLRSPGYRGLNEVPILVVSATFKGEQAAAITEETGANAFLAAPIDGNEFLATVERLLAGERPKARQRVLIVEDNESLASVLQRSFETHGYEARVAHDAGAARAVLERWSPRTVVLDHYLPDEPGGELLVELQQRMPDAAFIMITADSSPTLAVRWIRAGASAYVRKPFSPEYLLRLCEGARRERSLLRVEDILEERTQALRESERRHRAYVDHAPHGIFVVGVSGEIVDANPAAMRITGRSSDELTGMPFVDLIVEPEADRGKERTEPSARRRRPIRATLSGKELQLRTADGGSVHVRLDTAPLESGSTLAFCSDLTERKKAEEQRQVAEEQLRQAIKMEAIGRLAGGVAHDFNNLLTVILGHCEFLELEVREQDPLRVDVVGIHSAADRAESLVRQLLTFSRRQVHKPLLLDLNAIIEDIERLLRRLIGEYIRLELSLAPGLGPVLADPGQIEQVVMNLVVNARDAMPRGGQLLLQTLREDPPLDVAAPAAVAAPHVCIRVRDTGDGMDRDTQDRVFEPFFTTKERGKGTGLGLSTVYGIVRQSGGHIAVRSVPGEGSTFSVYLPQQDGVPETRARSTITEIPVSASQETLLLVEDDPAVRNVAKRILRRVGYEVLEAGDGQEAERISATHDGPIHLLLSDVVLPGPSGVCVAERLRALRPGLKALFMSGYTDDALEEHGGDLAELDLLEKPFSREELTARVRAALDGGS